MEEKKRVFLFYIHNVLNFSIIVKSASLKKEVGLGGEKCCTHGLIFAGELIFPSLSVAVGGGGCRK